MNSTQQTVVIVSPALADANNGNWQTARRWRQLLQSSVGPSTPRNARIVAQWPDGPQAAKDQCMIALHARRSAGSIVAWANSRSLGQSDPAVVQPVPGLAVVLTGTDLYRDILTDAQAQQSLQLAQRLVVLQSLGLGALPSALQSRASVIFQSTPARVALPKPTRFLKAVMVGHLREEKSPQTLFAAARLLKSSDAIHLDHIGAPLDAALAQQAQTTALTHPHYRWLGGLPHNTTRRHMQRAHLLVHTSRMEGGAHVVMEAVRCATPVLASRIAGNVGMLGEDYAGYFDWDDSGRLVALLRQCRDDADFFVHLQRQCAIRAPLFSTEVERKALHALADSLLPTPAA